MHPVFSMPGSGPVPRRQRASAFQYTCRGQRPGALRIALAGTLLLAAMSAFAQGNPSAANQAIGGAQTQGAKPISPEDRAAFDQMIKEYVQKNPAVIRDALESLKAQEQAQAAEKAKRTLVTEQTALAHDPDSPWVGSASPDVTVVEFFDYRCGFCKQMASTLAQLVASDPKVRVVYKEYPVLGPDSVYAAKASLAARTSPHFVQFHDGLISSSQLSADAVKKIAEGAGVDPAVLTHTEAPEITSLIEKNTKLAADLGVTGTPALVVGDQFNQGAVSLETIKAMVATERSKHAR